MSATETNITYMEINVKIAYPMGQNKCQNTIEVLVLTLSKIILNPSGGEQIVYLLIVCTMLTDDGLYFSIFS